MSRATNCLLRSSVFWQPLCSGGNFDAHIPFAFWLIDLLRPKLVVEAGCVSPVSYFAFCQAVERLGLPSQCLALDTVRSCDTTVAKTEADGSLDVYNERRYRTFSTIIRRDGPDAIDLFEAAAIDLLHLDLSTSAADVADIERWMAIMSPTGVLLLSNSGYDSSNPSARGIVSELRRSYPVFEFLHASTLTVVAVGKMIPTDLQGLLFSDIPPQDTQLLRNFFARLAAANSSVRGKNGGDDGAIPSLSVEAEATLGISATAMTERSGHSGEIPDIENHTQRTRIDEVEQQKTLLEGRLSKTEVVATQGQDSTISRDDLTRQYEAKVAELRAFQKQATLVERELLNLRRTVGEHEAKADVTARKLATAEGIQDRQCNEIVLLTQLLLQAESRLEKARVEFTRAFSRFQGTSKAERRKSAARRMPAMLKLFGVKGGLARNDAERRYLEAEKMFLSSSLFDKEWYVLEYPEVADGNMSPVEHYLAIGAALGYNPSPNFDSYFYMETYQDVAESGMNPLYHYLKFGISENRKPKAE